jgi:BlaI family transcriptional regulator, penicillinase repressor
MKQMDSRPLGKLEQLVMDVLWERGDGTVREVMNHGLVKDRAYTTIMTTLSRLHRKGLLAREGEGNAYRYRPRCDRVEHRRRQAHDVMCELLRDEGDVVLTAFVDAAGDADEAHLQRLSELVELRLHGSEGEG